MEHARLRAGQGILARIIEAADQSQDLPDRAADGFLSGMEFSALEEEHSYFAGLSVTNRNELAHSEVALEQQTLARFPAAEQEELAAYFRGYGADSDTAAPMAAAVSADPDRALRVHTREELGVDPNELPSPLLAGSRRCSRSRRARWSRCCPG